jgi:hypothetical protein
VTIRAFAGERASRTHENQMLQAFLEHLEPRWAASEDWIYVVANAMWEGAEVDVVCILPSAILVADFKSYQGRITGTENGRWQADGVVVKGGSKANPFAQIRDNKFSVINWHKRKDLLPGRNLGHVSGCVIFSGPITAEVDVSSNVKSWFHVTDFQHCASVIESLASPSLMLHESEAAEIVRLLGVGEHRWQRSHPGVESIRAAAADGPERPPLTQHQQDAVLTIASFLEAGSHRSLAVLGMTSTGKSRVLAETMNVAGAQGRQTVALAPNSRLAAIARKKQRIPCSSVYQHVFDVAKLSGKRRIKNQIVPISECKDPEDCVYLVDEAQLLSNALFETADGTRFGSGHLLADFFEFAQIGKSGRQVIFFGDQYQISRGNVAESVLDGGFQEARDLSHRAIELEQLIDTTGGSAQIQNAKLLVEAIRAKGFARLQFREDDAFRILTRQQAAVGLLEHFRACPSDVWYLAETHMKVGELTRWLRPKFLEKAELDTIEPGEMLEVFMPSWMDVADPFAEFVGPQFQAGQRIRVEVAGPYQQRSQPLNGQKVDIRFSTRACSLNSGRVDADRVEFLEDFLIAERPELPAATLVAIDVWCATNDHVGFVLARYGYASTVHHAQGMTQPLCYVNAEHAAGWHSEGYFRWLYTAITRAERSVALFNFEPIHPFDTAAWNPAAAQVSTNVPIGTGWQFDPDAAVSERDQQRDVPQGLLEHSKNPRISVAIWLRVVRGVEDAGWQVAKIASHAYQEQLELVGPNGDHLQLKIAYNGKNVVTAIHANDSADWQLLSAITAGCLASNAYSAIASMLLEALQVRLSRHDWQVVSATETNYRLLVTVAKGPADLVQLELNFDKQGLVSSIRPLLFSEEALVDQIRGAML